MIIEANREHINEVYHLLCVLEDQELDYELFKEKYIDGLSHKNIYYYVYVIDNHIVGFVSFYIHHYLHHNSYTGEIVELVVDPEYRGQNIGHQLIDYIECLARQLKLEEIELATSTYRKRAHHFYEVHGYIMNHYNYIKKL